MDFKKILNIVKGKSTLILIIMSILSGIYIITHTINQKTELQTYQARTSLAEQALRHPKIVKDTKTITVKKTQYINMTEQEKAEICEQYDLRAEHLNRVIRSLQRTTTTTEEVVSEKSEAFIPREPEAPSTRKWSIGMMGINSNGQTTFGIVANRDIGKVFEINAGISPQAYFAGALYKF